MKFLGKFCECFCKCNAQEKAFTLAEVLVTLGIIGVVSAMTLPTLVKNHQRTVYVTQLQKVVTELSQAAEKAAQEYNAISLDETKYNDSNPNGASSFLNDNFKVVNNCGADLTPCFASEYKTLQGKSYTLESPIAVVTLASGASISIIHNYMYYEQGYHGNYDLQVDVNGPQGPNILGRDLFTLGLYSDGKVAEHYSYIDDDGWRFEENCSTGEVYGFGCFDKIVNDGWKMDY